MLILFSYGLERFEKFIALFNRIVVDLGGCQAIGLVLNLDNVKLYFVSWSLYNLFEFLGFRRHTVVIVIVHDLLGCQLKLP